MSSKQFLEQVGSFIRSKEARGYVEKEIQQHLHEAQRAWQNKGYSATEAEQKAIAEMGSASQLGKSMNKIHRPKWDVWLIGAVVLLLIASFIPLVTIDYTVQFGGDMKEYLIRNKFIHIILAIAVITGLMYFDYRKLQRYSLLIYSVALLLLGVLLFIPNSFIHGEAMYKIGPVSIQAWTVLPLLIVAFAGFFANCKWKVWQLACLFIVPLYFFMTLPNLTVTMFYIAVIAILFCFSVFSRKTKLVVCSVVAAITFACIGYIVYAYNHLFAPYQMMRIKAFLNPELYAEEEGYLMILLKDALENAGWFGSDKMYYIPNAYSDYALVQLIQAYGYVVGIAVIALIVAVSLRILWLLRTMPQSFGKLLVLAAVTLYTCQSVYSMLMVFGVLPIIGVPLPFISYGATPLLLNAMLIGFVLSVYRRRSMLGTVHVA